MKNYQENQQDPIGIDKNCQILFILILLDYTQSIIALNCEVK